MLGHLFLHVVLVRPQADVVEAEIGLHHGTCHWLAVSVLHLIGHLASGGGLMKGHEVAVFEVNHRLRDLQEGRGVGCDVGLVWARAHANEQGGSQTGGHQAARVLAADGRQGIGAFEPLADGPQGRGQVVGLAPRLVQQVHHHLGVCLGLKGVAGCLEFGAKVLVVLDDAVVNQADLQPLAAGEVGVGVVLCDCPVGGPAGVGNADVRRQTLGRGSQFCNPADRANARDLAALEQREPCGVVAPVFELAKAFDQEGRDVLGGDGADNATHLVILSGGSGWWRGC